MESAIRKLEQARQRKLLQYYAVTKSKIEDLEIEFIAAIDSDRRFAKVAMFKVDGTADVLYFDLYDKELSRVTNFDPVRVSDELEMTVYCRETDQGKLANVMDVVENTLTLFVDARNQRSTIEPAPRVCGWTKTPRIESTDTGYFRGKYCVQNSGISLSI